MKNLEIGDHGFSLPIELATGSIAMLATKGSGKTYTAAVLTEELIERGVPVVSIDPTGAHWGLKSSATGKSEGYPVTIFGGDHADLPLEEAAGEVLARAIADHRFCAILDLSHFRKAQIYRFLTPFVSELWRLNRQPLQLICDEADLYCPQKVAGDTAKLVGAMEDIVRRGRSRGIGTTLITQRPASLNKDVLTQCDCLVALRIGHPRDIDPVMEWVYVHGDKKTAEKMVSTLPTMPTGTAWIWAPRMDIFERVAIRRRTTFDSSQTPEIGKASIEPTVMAKVDLEKLGKEIASTAQRAKENDPVELRRTIASLKAQIAKKDDVPILMPPKRIEIEVPVLDMGAQELLRFTGQQLKLAHDDFKRIEIALNAKAKRIPRMIPIGPQIVVVDPQKCIDAAKMLDRRAEQIRPMRLRQEAGSGEPKPIGACARAILTAAKQRHPRPCTRSQLAIVSGYSIRSSTFGNALSELRTAGLIEGYGDSITLTTEGLDKTLHISPVRSDADVRSSWLSKLNKAERTILEVLIAAYPAELDRQTVAEQSSYSITSSTFGNALSTLRTLELMTRGPLMKASETLFEI